MKLEIYTKYMMPNIFHLQINFQKIIMVKLIEKIDLEKKFVMLQN